MKRRHTIVAILFVLAGCAGSEDPAPANTGGSPAGAASPASGGSSGLGSAGMSAAGANAGRSGGPSTAGSSGSAGGTTAGASGNSSDTVPATFDTLKLVLGGGGGIMPCAAAPCHGVHGMAPPSRPLELPPNDDAQLYMNLTTYVSAACGNIKLVTPGNPDQSALLRILKGPCGMTPRMPYGCSAEAGNCIPDDYIAAVAQWIASGAARP
jgi:hypothetical protein